jgi:hypothetical protein
MKRHNGTQPIKNRFIHIVSFVSFQTFRFIRIYVPKSIVKFRKPTLDGTWKPTTSSNFTSLEYFQFNETSDMKVGYRAKDQIAWNQVRILTMSFLKKVF